MTSSCNLETFVGRHEEQRKHYEAKGVSMRGVNRETYSDPFYAQPETAFGVNSDQYFDDRSMWTTGLKKHPHAVKIDEMSDVDALATAPVVLGHTGDTADARLHNRPQMKHRGAFV